LTAIGVPNRRQVIEGVNGMLKGGFVNIQHKFFRVFGLTKTKLLLAFTVVAYNLEAIRSFLAKKSREGSDGGEEPSEEDRGAAREHGRRSSDHLIGRHPTRRDRGAHLLRPDPHRPAPLVLDQERHRTWLGDVLRAFRRLIANQMDVAGAPIGPTRAPTAPRLRGTPSVTFFSRVLRCQGPQF
jgi:hypothetical protein